jgi:hypothetical protein
MWSKKSQETQMVTPTIRDCVEEVYSRTESENAQQEKLQGDQENGGIKML